MDTIAKLADGFCPLAATDVFTATSKTSVIAIDIVNPTAFTQNVAVKMHGALLFTIPVPQSGQVSWNGPQVLETGQTINIIADSASCTYNISGVVVT